MLTRFEGCWYVMTVLFIPPNQDIFRVKWGYYSPFQDSKQKMGCIQKWSESCSVMSNSLWPHGLYSPWNSPGQNTGVDSLSLFQGSSQPRDWSQVSCISSRFFISWTTKEAQRILKWVAYSFSRGSSWPRNRTGISHIAGRFFINWAIREGPTHSLKVKVAQPCLTICNCMDCPWNSPDQNTRVGSLSLLQGIFPTQGLNPGLPHCRWILYQLSYQGQNSYS